MLQELLLEPRIAMIIFMLVIVGYLIFLDKENAFQNKFLHFGPSPDSKFLNISLDNWGKVISVYLIGFISAFSTSYYSNVTSSFVSGVLLNPAFKDKIEHSAYWGKILVVVDPIISWIMTSFQFFITLTMELQYMLPQFLGHIAVTIPTNLYNISFKKFSRD
jgi:hypothetical protein